MKVLMTIVFTGVTGYCLAQMAPPIIPVPPAPPPLKIQPPIEDSASADDGDFRVHPELARFMKINGYVLLFFPVLIYISHLFVLKFVVKSELEWREEWEVRREARVVYGMLHTWILGYLSFCVTFAVAFLGGVWALGGPATLSALDARLWTCSLVGLGYVLIVLLSSDSDDFDGSIFIGVSGAGGLLFGAIIGVAHYANLAGW